MKICHLTSAHPRDDIRIFRKECVSLKNAGFDISLIVADGLGNETKEGVSIFDVGKQDGRLKRILKTPRAILRKALELDASVYHFHDPELLRIYKKLIKHQKRVIYDVHEDVPLQLLSKPYLTPWILKRIAWFFNRFEKKTASKIHHIVTATPDIENKFKMHNPNVTSICNYPIIKFSEIPTWESREDSICYIGGIFKIRGIIELISILDGSFKLKLAGKYSPEDLKEELEKMPNWKFVEEFGYVDHHKISEILGSSKIGMVTLHPMKNYLESLPVKMFEYMAAGIPVIASDFPLWKNIIEDAQCGICVNPLDANEIYKAVKSLLSDDQKANFMGQNGRKAVKEKYNWENEAKKLISLYRNQENRIASFSGQSQT